MQLGPSFAQFKGSELDQKAGGVVVVLSWANGYVRR